MTSCLIVDDSRVIRKLARRICEAEGFTCDEAEHGAEALAKCRTALPDVLLVDWNMPVMNGLDFVVALRAMPDGDKPRIILCTTMNDMDDIMMALKAGANEYVMKPYDADIMRGKFEMLGLALRHAG